VRDITERKHAEEALRASRLITEEIINSDTRAGVLEGQVSSFTWV